MQTIEGAKKAVQRNIENHGSYDAWVQFMKNIASQGGKVKSPTKGFGKSREWASECGKKGGQKSRRTKVAA